MLTPVPNDTLPARPAHFAEPTATLTELIAAGSEGPDGHRRIIFPGSGEATWEQIYRDGCAYASVLSNEHGIGPGDKVALLGLTSQHLVTAIVGTWLVGGCVMVLPLSPSGLAHLAEDTYRRLKAADADLLVLDELTASVVPPAPEVLASTTTLDALDAAARGSGTTTDGVPSRRRTLDDLAILQFTSGTTSDPKGVRVTDRVLLANVAAVVDHVQPDHNRDVVVSWLPLFHDMGLVGIFVSCLLGRLPLVLASPLDFVQSPGRWMEWISQYGGTITAGPNFAYVRAASILERRLQRGGAPLDLSTLRVAINGAEPIDAMSVDRWLAAGRPYGLPTECPMAAYGMAEVGIAAALAKPFSGLHLDVIDAATIADPRHPAAIPVDEAAAEGPVRKVPLCGATLAGSGLTIRIVDPLTGDELPRRRVGEVEITGPTVAPGYYGHEEFDSGPDASAPTRTYRFRPGDLGYLTENGEIGILGRTDDKIIVAGRNVWPQDIERAVSEVDGIRPGHAAAIGVWDRTHGTEKVVVFAEARGESSALVGAVKAQVAQVCGLTPAHVQILSPGSLPKTTSGKLQRHLVADQFLDLETIVTAVAGARS